MHTLPLQKRVIKPYDDISSSNEVIPLNEGSENDLKQPYMKDSSSRFSKVNTQSMLTSAREIQHKKNASSISSAVQVLNSKNN